MTSFSLKSFWCVFWKISPRLISFTDSSTTNWWSAIFELYCTFYCNTMAINWVFTNHVTYGSNYTPSQTCLICIRSLWLAITFRDFKAFIQLAPISRPTSTSSVWVISGEIVFRKSYSSVFSGAATSFLSTGKCFLTEILGSFIHVLPSFDPATFNPSIDVVDSDLSPCSVFKFSVVFLPDVSMVLTSAS